MKRTLLMTSLIAAGAIASAPSFATYFGDENDHSWLPRASAAEVAPSAAPQSFVHHGDENDLSWLHGSRPSATDVPTAVPPLSAEKSEIIRYGDEQNLAWIYRGGTEPL